MAVTLEISKDSEEWDNLVEKSPHGTIFHTWKFLKIVEKHTNSKLYPIIGMKGTTPVGIYPLFLQKKFFLRLVFSPPPHVAVPYLGPVIVDYDKLKQSKKESIFINFQKAVDEFISSELKADYVYISTPPKLLDSRPLRWVGYEIKPLHSYIIDLSKGIDCIWKQFEKKLRQNINKTKREGISVEEGSKEEFERIYDLLVERYKEQGRIVTVSKEYLCDVYNSFYPENIRITVVKYMSDIITGSIDTYYKDILTSWIGHTKTKIKNIYPNDLLRWEAIEWAYENGLRYYEEIGAGVEKLCTYKAKLNPRLVVHFSATKHTSIVSKMAEDFYFRILKPTYTKIKLMKKSYDGTKNSKKR